jgi:hypothetical protein
MRKTLFGLLCLPLLLLISSGSKAQDTVVVPGDSKFVLQVDLQAMRSSKVGGPLFEMATKAAIEEMGKGDKGDGLSLEKIKEFIGFDPLTEVQGIVVCASEFEKPEKSLLGMVRLKKTTGNIEGLLLGLPGYEKSDHRDYEIHSATPGDEGKVFGSIHKDKSGNNTLIIGAQKESVTQLLDSLDKVREDKSLKTVTLDSDRKVLASIQLLEIPTKELGKGPQANIANLLTSLVLSIQEDADDLEIRGAMQAATEKQADKIKQSFQGLAALLELFASMDDEASEDPEMKQVIEFVKQIKVTQEGSSVKVRLRLPSSQISEMIQKELSK